MTYDITSKDILVYAVKAHYSMDVQHQTFESLALDVKGFTYLLHGAGSFLRSKLVFSQSRYTLHFILPTKLGVG